MINLLLTLLLPFSAFAQCENSSDVGNLAISPVELTPHVIAKNNKRFFKVSVKAYHYACAYSASSNPSYHFAAIAPLANHKIQLLNGSGHVTHAEAAQILLNPAVDVSAGARLETGLENILTNYDMNLLLQNPAQTVERDITITIQKPTNKYTSFSGLRYYVLHRTIVFFNQKGEIDAR